MALLRLQLLRHYFEVSCQWHHIFDIHLLQKKNGQSWNQYLKMVFPPFFFGLGFLIIFPNGVYETSSSIRLRGVKVVHFRVKFWRVAEAASLSQSSPPLFWSHELDSGRFSSVVNLAWSSSNSSVVVFYLTQVAMNMVYLPGFEILFR